MVSILLDGLPLSIADGSRLSDLLPSRDPSCCVAVIRPGTRESASTSSLQINTTAGEIVAEMVGKEGIPSGGDPSRNLALKWSDRDAAAFGPFPADFSPDKKAHLYERGDLILGCGGYDPKQSYFVFSRRRHSADHGAAADGGVVGRVVSGRGILDRWIPGDRVLTIEPVISWADTSRSFTTSDNSMLLDEGMQIVTNIRISVQGWSPEGITTSSARSVEHLLLSLSDGHLKVGRASSTHIRDERRSGEEVPQELNRPRREGAVTIRTRGTSQGSVYIYTADVPSNPGHTLVGQVVHGIELAKLAREGDTLCVGIGPGLLDFRGLTAGEALDLAKENQIGAGLDVEDPENRVVVGQAPETTLEIVSGKQVRLSTAPLSRVITVALDSVRAPLSVALFRRITGLHSHAIGSLPLFFMYEDVYLFKPVIPKGMQILPENTPSGEVPAGTLAITNEARRGAGLIGIRTRPNSEFGPTSEPFEGTNILGTVLDIEKLGTASEKDIVYVKELKG